MACERQRDCHHIRWIIAMGVQNHDRDSYRILLYEDRKIAYNIVERFSIVLHGHPSKGGDAGAKNLGVLFLK